MPDEQITIQHERLETFPNTVGAACRSCGDPILLQDVFCVRISLPRQDPQRFHDQCFSYLLRGLTAFERAILFPGGRQHVH